ncbi:MAG: Zn-ribbon domain-containing OB-fold protein, partial [Candidatus Binatia bacterium]
MSEELRPFFAAAREGRLVVQRCPDCGALRFPPRPICSHCLGRRAEWTTVSGRGEIFSFNVMHQVYHPGFAGDVPYAVVLVELEEGCR